jgi:hypothetical protein
MGMFYKKAGHYRRMDIWMHSVVGTGVKEVCSCSLFTDGWLVKARHLMGMVYQKQFTKGAGNTECILLLGTGLNSCVSLN